MEENIGFDGVMRNILPLQARGGNIYKPGVTHSGGERQGFDAYRKGRRHGGVDMNYRNSSGAAVGQNGINLSHPDVGSPIAGEVTDTNKDYGMVEVTDMYGFRHRIRHLHTRTVEKGDRVEAGQVIGQMGGRGPDGANQYDQHVHYELVSPQKLSDKKDESAKAIDPEAYLDNPAKYWDKHLDFSTRYLLTNPPVGRPSSSILRQGHGVTGAAGNGETLRRDNVDWRVVHRVEENGSGRGSFISE
ncbi:MAG: M23 family metallopeptidase [Deltaproteobacteria bacterium]|nr:M23 family metallopeptidase [Deltaproteobacteria bacterium]